MELDQLKVIWQRKTSAFTPKNDNELSAMLRGSSKSIVSKLKRSVWFEITITVMAGIGLLVYVSSLESGAVKWTSIALLLLFFAYLFFYFKKLILLRAFGRTTGSLHESLTTLVTGLEGYITFFERSYIILYPTFFVLALVFIAIDKGWDAFVARFDRPDVLFNTLVVILVYFAVVFWFTRWYIRKLFGTHLDKLRSILQDLGETSGQEKGPG